MKTHFTLIYCILLLLSLHACKDGPLVRKATGMPYEVVVSTENKLWNNELGKAIKEDLASHIPGLPQIEPTMRITYVSPDQFNGLLTYVRCIFIANINPQMYTKVSLIEERDRWAKGQIVMTLNAPTEEEAIEFLRTHPKVLVNRFAKEEMKRATSLIEKDYSQVVYQKVKDQFDISLKVPDNLTYYRDTTGFFWASNNAKTGRIDIAVYAFPYTDPETFTLEYLVAKRDSFMKTHMPGAFPNSYMTTETRYIMPEYTPISVNGKYAGELRGLWRVEGDMMGGPFVSHARLDEVNNRVVVVEGFVFSPETDKRNYIRRIEAALYTLQLPGEEKTIEIEEENK